MDGGYDRGYRGRGERGWTRPERPYRGERRPEDTQWREREEGPRQEQWEGYEDARSYGHQAGWDEPERRPREHYEPHWNGPGPQYRPREEFRDEPPPRSFRYEYPTRPYEEEGPFGHDWEERERRWHEERRNEYGREDRHYREELGWQGQPSPSQRSGPPERPRRRQEPSRWY